MNISSNNLRYIFLCFFLISFQLEKVDVVSNIHEFNESVQQAKPGDIITLTNGVWKDTVLVFAGEGIQDQLTILAAEEKGKVTLAGQSNLKISGKYLHVEGLVFRNEHTLTGSVISFRNDKT